VRVSSLSVRSVGKPKAGHECPARFLDRSILHPAAESADGLGFVERSSTRTAILTFVSEDDERFGRRGCYSLRGSTLIPGLVGPTFQTPMRVDHRTTPISNISAGAVLAASNGTFVQEKIGSFNALCDRSRSLNLK